MSNYRENLINDFSRRLVDLFDADQISIISNKLILAMEDYEISERCTELAVIDDGHDRIVAVYLGTLKTEGKSPKTIKGYARIINRFLDDVNCDLRNIGVYHFRLWIAKLQDDGVSLRTCENYRSYLSAFFKWLTDEEIIDKNPMAKIKPIKYVEETKIPFSDVEIDRMRGICKVKERAILEVLLSSGVRVSELCAINIGDVNFREKSILIREAKGGKQRTVYFSDVALSHLEDYLSTRKDNYSPLFITNRKTRYKSNSIQNMMREIGRRSFVKNVHPHRFRRTFASTMYRRGVDVRTIQLLMGHSSIETTMIYIHSDQDAVKNTYRKSA